MAVQKVVFSCLSLFLLFCVHYTSGIFPRKTEVFTKSAENLNISYKTNYISLPVDHFGFSNEDRFQLRYLVADQFWDPKSGPIFLYTGNEGDIEWFCNNTGFMWDIAPEYKALLLFVEHRYYGKSLPYGKDSYKDLAHVGYLSSEQALADFAETVRHVTSTLTPEAGEAQRPVPVVAFGGSYGGMLAAWFRIKYPHIVIGSLAASAPVLWFENLTPCNSFSLTVTKDFARESAQCPINIRRSWGVIDNMAKTESGRAKLSRGLRLCAPLTKASQAVMVKEWLTDVWGNLAMVDYPYAASFLEPLPGWPIKEVCSHLSDGELTDSALITALGGALDVYFNYTGAATCFNTSQQAGSGLDDQGWGFQSCTEMVMPMCSDGRTDMFEPAQWDLTQFARGCMKQWGVNPRATWIVTQYGGKNISAASNIIFSNGALDPWSGGGFKESVSDTLVAIEIAEGAHHLDLRSSNSADPPSVIKARKQEKAIISKWLQEFQEQHRSRGVALNIYDHLTRVSHSTRSVIIAVMVLSACVCLLAFSMFIMRHQERRLYEYKVMPAGAKGI